MQEVGDNCINHKQAVSNTDQRSILIVSDSFSESEVSNTSFLQQRRASGLYKIVKNQEFGQN